MAVEHCDQGPWCEPASGGQAEADSEAWLTGTALLRLLPIGGRRSGSDTRYTGPAPRQASPPRAGASTSLQEMAQCHANGLGAAESCSTLLELKPFFPTNCYLP